MCDFERVTPRSRGKTKRFLWPNKAGPPCRARAPARDAPPGQTVGADALIGTGKGRALALREHIPRLNSPPNPAETIPKPVAWLSRAGPPHRARVPARAAPSGRFVGADVLIGPGKSIALALQALGPPWREPEEHIPRLNGPPNQVAGARRFLWLGRAGPPGKEGALPSA